jgi:hypothetical protein
MTFSIRNLAVLVCLSAFAPAFAQSPPTPPQPPVEPPPVLDPAPPPMHEDGTPIEALPTPTPIDKDAQLQLDSARLQCQTLPEQQRQACLDAAQRAFEQARRRTTDPVR